MTHAVLRNIRLYLRLLSAQLRSQMQYRFSFFLDIMGTALIVIVEFGSLALVFQRFDHIQGWRLAEVAFLYGLVEISFGLMDLTFAGFDPADFGRYIRRGGFDQFLLRPANLTVQVMGSALTLRRLGRVVMGGAVFALALNSLEIQWTVAKLAYLPFVVAGMVCFFGGLYLIGSTITFWTVDSIEIMNIFTYGGSFVMSYPMHIYQAWLRHLFTFLLPAIFLNYYPALYFLDKPDPFGFPSFAPFVAPFVGLALLAGAHAIWRFGVRFYKSTGT